MENRWKDFMIGVNYWDSASGTDMWAKFDADVIEKDLTALEGCGVKYMRVFPNWRDFQPVCSLIACHGDHKQYLLTGDRKPENEFYIDPVMIDRFLLFCDMAKKHGMKLIVSILTGWMSGRMFCPPALEGKDLISNYECLRFESKFIRGFVRMVKHHDAIAVWDLGNECNCLGNARSRSEAYVWTANVRNSILAEDQTRAIMSGMHALDHPNGQAWTIEDQGELTDMLTPHPYPSPTIGGDVEPADRLRTTMLPTAQCAYYSDISGKPAMIQEQGTFSDMLINREGAADFMRVNVCSSWANGYKGYLWWCGMEHLKLTQPPYCWSMIERELGMVDVDRNPKPVGREMKRLSDLLDTLPELPEKQRDAVCVLSYGQNQWQVGAANYILCKMAGLEVTMFKCAEEFREIPHAPLYFLPSICGWAALYKDTWDTLVERVRDEGASLLVTVNSGLLTEFEKLTGMRSDGMLNGGRETATFDFEDGKLSVPFNYGKKFLLHSIGAEVLGTDGTGNVVLSRNRLGKGYIYLLGFPLESFVWSWPMVFAGDNMPEYYKIYRAFGRNVLDAKPLVSDNPQLGLTLHPNADGSYYAVAVNYSEKAQDTQFRLADGWRSEAVLGEAGSVPKCDMSVLKLVRA